MEKPNQWQLAQINITKMKFPLDHPQMADFAAQIPVVNQLADQSPGFVWRYESEALYASGEEDFGDPMVIINLTVWESLPALQAFTYNNPTHLKILKGRRKWFFSPGVSFVLWWVNEGHRPSIAEGKRHLDLLNEEGPSQEAFTFWHCFDPPQQELTLTTPPCQGKTEFEEPRCNKT